MSDRARRSQPGAVWRPTRVHVTCMTPLGEGGGRLGRAGSGPRTQAPPPASGRRRLTRTSADQLDGVVAGMLVDSGMRAGRAEVEVGDPLAARLAVPQGVEQERALDGAVVALYDVTVRVLDDERLSGLDEPEQED